MNRFEHRRSRPLFVGLTVLFVPLFLLCGVWIDVVRTSAVVSSFLSMIPSDVRYFAATDRLDNFVARAGHHSALITQLLGRDSSDRLIHLGGGCVVAPKSDTLSAVGVDGARAAAALMLSDADLALVIPVTNHLLLRSYIRKQLPDFVLVMDDSDGISAVRVSGRATPGAKVCLRDSLHYTVPADGKVDFVVKALPGSRIPVAITDDNAAIDISLDCTALDDKRSSVGACTCKAAGNESCSEIMPLRSVAAPKISDGALQSLFYLENEGLCYAAATPDIAVVVLRRDSNGECTSAQLDNLVSSILRPSNLNRFYHDDTFATSLRLTASVPRADESAILAVLPIGEFSSFGPLIIRGIMGRNTFDAKALLPIETSNSTVLASFVAPFASGATVDSDPAAFTFASFVDPATSHYLHYLRTYYGDFYGAIVGAAGLERAALFRALPQDSKVTVLQYSIRPDDAGAPGEVITVDFGEGGVNPVGSPSAEKIAQAYLEQIDYLLTLEQRRVRLRAAIDRTVKSKAGELGCTPSNEMVVTSLSKYKSEIDALTDSIEVSCDASSLNVTLSPTGKPNPWLKVLEREIADLLENSNTQLGCDLTADQIVGKLSLSARSIFDRYSPRIRVSCDRNTIESRIYMKVLPAGRIKLSAVENLPETYYVSPALDNEDIATMPNAEADNFDAAGLLAGKYRWVGRRVGARVTIASRPSVMASYIASHLTAAKVNIRLASTINTRNIKEQLMLYPDDVQSALTSSLDMNLLSNYDRVQFEAAPLENVPGLLVTLKLAGK